MECQFYGPSSTERLLFPVEPNPIFLAAGGAALPPTWPKPSLATPMPNLSTSLELRLWPLVAPKPGLFVLMGVGETILDFSACFAFVVAAACSASGSYPSFSIRSASSFAFLSAASKSTTSPTFFAPSFCVFLAPRTLALRGAPVAVALRIVDEEMVRDGWEAGVSAVEDSLSTRGEGDFGLDKPLPLVPGLRNGDPVRLMTGGV